MYRIFLREVMNRMHLRYIMYMYLHHILASRYRRWVLCPFSVAGFTR
jgi:hypothetical protein